ncbi:protein translocase subunit SecF [Microlunatus antarcticus]|uniref:Protein-export membrane protein SecF n=1 Tax=Microlunatus antarcticus TaxID=53388 RepID=A0A7W5JW06_9ACTN|nr:protein translocase subunit SecF [Microlunatus antarcticus]MBB3327330.1 preprotein translocase subunit SecF [Microlunatus antarcticus]
MSKFSDLGHRLYTGEVSYDFIARRRRWYIFSGILLTVSILALLLKGLTLGIEFEGGADFQAPTNVSASQMVQPVRDALERSGVPNLNEATVNTIGSNQVRVQTRTLDTTTEVPAVRGAIGQAVGVPGDQVNYSLIGASWGGQITERALIALIVFLVLVSLVIWIYFRDAKMSGAALVALLHDLLLTVGIYALVGFTVTPATLIGVLTILGYSLYDTVVVFDKVRENVKGVKTSTTKTYSEAANLAVNQVLVRSINTTIIGVLPVAALLFAGTFILGEGPLKDLSLALFVGMVSGAYSSIFIATPLLAQLKEREPDMARHRARVQTRRDKAEGRSAPAAAADDTSADDRLDEPDGLVGVAPGAAEEVALGAKGGTRVTAVPASARPAVRPVVEGAAKRPQPQNAPRSQRKR